MVDVQRILDMATGTLSVDEAEKLIQEVLETALTGFKLGECSARDVANAMDAMISIKVAGYVNQINDGIAKEVEEINRHIKERG
jgi:hypothetical protein